MSSDPSLDLQKAVIGVWRGSDPTLAGGAVVARQIWDHVPPNAVFPYISVGPSQVLSDDADCVTGYEVFFQLDVWSRAVGQPEMKQISGELKLLLHSAEFSLDDHVLVLLEHDGTRYLTDPDGLTQHGAVGFRALVNRLAA